MLKKLEVGRIYRNQYGAKLECLHVFQDNDAVFEYDSGTKSLYTENIWGKFSLVPMVKKHIWYIHVMQTKDSQIYPSLNTCSEPPPPCEQHRGDKCIATHKITHEQIIDK